MNVLDDHILGSKDTDFSHFHDSRSASIAHSVVDDSASRDHSMWSEYAHQMAHAAMREPSQLNSPLFEQQNNAFIAASHPQAPRQRSQSMQQQQTLNFGQYNPPSWPLPSADSGSNTPTVYDHYPQSYDSANGTGFSTANAVSFTPVDFRMESIHGPHGAAMAVPMSPQSSQSWSATSSDLPDQRSRQARSPTIRAASPLQMRRDGGVRKKNARFEIPAERTLNNIDSLIKQSTDEHEVKELKQQKRLLRNRQAA